jgi:hypothetical protein
MNDKQLKILILFFIFFLQIILISIVNFNSNNIIFIFFIIFITIFSIFFYFTNYSTKIKILIFSLATYFLLLIIEFNYTKIFYSSCVTNQCENYEKKKIEKNINKKIHYVLLPKSFVLENNKILPLSFFQSSYVLGANENNYYPYFITDRYGFINQDYIYSRKEIDFLIIGDSYAMGITVNFSDNIQGNLLNKNKTVISLGMGGNGPLFSLAALVEYKNTIKAKNVIYIFSETNDLGYDLFLEKKNDILIRYLNKNFKQKLLFKTKEINSLLVEKYSNLEKIKNNNNNTIVSIKTITLSNIRYLIGIENKGSKNIDGNYNPDFSYNLIEAVNSNTLNSNYFLFNKIIARMKEESDPSNFYLLYVPERKNLFSKKKSKMYYAVKKICEKNNVKFIDLSEELKDENIKFIKSLYPRSFEHPNEKGYKFISNIILKNVSK